MKRSPLVILFITVVIDLLGFGVIMPLLPTYVSKHGGGPVMSGWLAVSFSVMQFIFAPLWGMASDRWGRRPFILLSLVGSAVTFLLFGLANHLWVLFAARIGAGVLTAASLPAAYAYIADVMPPERRSRGMAMIGAAFGLGFAIGPWIGTLLGHYGLAVPAFFVSGLACVNFAWSYFALPETHHPDPEHMRKLKFLDTHGMANAFHNHDLRDILLVFSVSNFAFAMMEATFTWLVLIKFMGLSVTTFRLTPALEHRVAPTVGPIFGTIGLTILLAQGAVMSGLAQRIGERRLVWSGALFLTIALLGIGEANTLLSLTVMAACLAIGSGMLTPSLSSLVSQAASPKERGSIMGVQHSLGSLMRIAAPLLGTWLIQRYHPETPYVAAAVLMGIAFLLSLRIRQPSSVHTVEIGAETISAEA